MTDAGESERAGDISVLRTVYLFGADLSYSYSERINNDYFERYAPQIRYVAHPVPRERDFDDEFWKVSHTPDFLGANITVPYKERVLRHCDGASQGVTDTGAANTVVRAKDGRILAFNTDIAGFIGALAEEGMTSVETAAVLGTGGAAKAVILALLRLGARLILVGLRDPINIGTVTFTFGNRREVFRFADMEDMQYSKSEAFAEMGERADLIVNATPLGTAPRVEKSPIMNAAVFGRFRAAFDLVYNPAETKFLRLAAEGGAKPIGGLRMLEMQAAESRRIWLDEDG